MKNPVHFAVRTLALIYLFLWLVEGASAWALAPGACANTPVKFRVIAPYLFDPNEAVYQDGKTYAEVNAQRVLDHTLQNIGLAMSFYSTQLNAKKYADLGVLQIVEARLVRFDVNDFSILHLFQPLEWASPEHPIGISGIQGAADIQNAARLKAVIPNLKEPNIITILAVDLIGITYGSEAVCGFTWSKEGFLMMSDPLSPAVHDQQACKRTPSEVYLEHEMGHLFGLDHMIDGNKYCNNVMSYCASGTYGINAIQAMTVNGHLCGDAPLRFETQDTNTHDRFVNIFDQPNAGNHCGNGEIGLNEDMEPEECETSLRMTQARNPLPPGYTEADLMCAFKDPLKPDTSWPALGKICTRKCKCETVIGGTGDTGGSSTHGSGTGGSGGSPGPGAVTAGDHGGSVTPRTCSEANPRARVFQGPDGMLVPALSCPKWANDTCPEGQTCGVVYGVGDPACDCVDQAAGIIPE